VGLAVGSLTHTLAVKMHMAVVELTPPEAYPAVDGTAELDMTIVTRFGDRRLAGISIFETHGAPGASSALATCG
jgi:hypothetical protein